MRSVPNVAVHPACRFAGGSLVRSGVSARPAPSPPLAPRRHDSDAWPCYERDNGGVCMGPISEERARWLARHILPHEPALRAWLRRKTAAVEIDDVVQEAYAILAAKADVAAIRNPKSYLFQVAYSVILQDLRRARVVAIASVQDLGDLDLASEEPSAEDTVAARQDLERVRRVISAMPQQTRRAFALRRVEGLSQAEIAGAMRISEHTVEKHIARGIKFLLAAFADGGNAAPPASKSEEQEPKTRDLAQAKRGNHRP